jgi:hypothetical protein
MPNSSQFSSKKSDSVWRRIGKIMKLLMPLLGNRRGFALLAGAAVLATGCVERQVTYVQPEPPPAYQPPAEVPPPQPPPEVVVAPNPAPIVVLRSPRELEQMVASIALYPDPLLAQILPAATVPQQIVWANSYLSGGGDPRGVDLQAWDNSIKALARYPEVLRMMGDNLAWTTDLGTAFMNQPVELMDAVQRLRAEARALGNLYSTPEQVVYVDGPTIVIAPAVREVIYVPVYRPEVVYIERPPAPDRFFISFSVGHPMGVWLNHDCDWHERRVVVWHHDHPRPADWWEHRPSERPREEAHNITAWRAPAERQVPPGQRPPGHRPGEGHPTPPPVVTHPAPAPPQPVPAPVAHSGAHLVPPGHTPPESAPVHSGAHPTPGSLTGGPASQGSHPTSTPPPGPVTLRQYPGNGLADSGARPTPMMLPKPVSVPVLKDPNKKPDGQFIPAPKDPRAQPITPQPTPPKPQQYVAPRPPAESDLASNKNPGSHTAYGPGNHAVAESTGHGKPAHEVNKENPSSKPVPPGHDKEDKKPHNSDAN